MKAILVANPRAGGRGERRDLSRLAARLEEAGMEVQPLHLSSPAAAPEALCAALHDASPEDTRVVVAGGDGTINALLPALIGCLVPVALLPCGTFNVLARDLGVPLRWEQAVAVVAGGRPRFVDVGLANGRPFADMVGVGYDAAIVQDIVPAGNKSRWHYPAYIARATRLLAGFRPRTFRITADGRSFETDA